MKKNFRSTEPPTKTSFFHYFRARHKKFEGNKKGYVESTYARVTKHASKKVAKADVNMNWLLAIDYRLFWLCIYIPVKFSQFDTNVLTGSMISLFLAATALRVRRTCNLMWKSVRNEPRFLLLFGKISTTLYRRIKFCYW